MVEARKTKRPTQVEEREVIMSVAIPLSIVGIVVAFMINVLGGFPISAGPSASPAVSGPIDEAYSTEAVDSAFKLFSGTYMSVIDELVSFQRDPDYERAERRRQDMVGYGISVMERYGALGDRLHGELDRLTAQSAASTTVPQ